MTNKKTNYVKFSFCNLSAQKSLKLENSLEISLSDFLSPFMYSMHDENYIYFYAKNQIYRMILYKMHQIECQFKYISQLGRNPAIFCL